MSLIKCPDCGESISENAAACIHCGAPIRRPLQLTLNSKHFIAISLIILVGAIGKRFFYTSTPVSENGGREATTVSAEKMSDFGGPYHDAIMNSKNVVAPKDEKKLYALMVEHEIAMNRVLPRIVNPSLKLHDVNYKHSKRTTEYRYEALGQFTINDEADLNSRLQKRYCEEEEFKLHRNNNVAVLFLYWNDKGMLLHRYETEPCY